MNYSGMVGKVAGSSTGARALKMMGPMAAKVAEGATAASGRMGAKVLGSSGARSSMYKAGMRAAGAVASHPMRSIGAAGVGLGAAAGYGAMRRRGSQNYPMY